jgi:hypothetical protein
VSLSYADLTILVRFTLYIYLKHRKDEQERRNIKSFASEFPITTTGNNYMFLNLPIFGMGVIDYHFGILMEGQTLEDKRKLM